MLVSFWIPRKEASAIKVIEHVLAIKIEKLVGLDISMRNGSPTLGIHVVRVRHSCRHVVSNSQQLRLVMLGFVQIKEIAATGIIKQGRVGAVAVNVHHVRVIQSALTRQRRGDADQSFEDQSL